MAANKKPGDFIDYVMSNDLCTGCGMCEGLAKSKGLTVELDEKNGLYRPKKNSTLSVDLSESIGKTCPGANVEHDVTGDNFDPVWGPIESISLSASSHPDVRHNGSSGGVLSALQIYLLEENKVDYILSTKVNSDDPFGTEISISRTRQDVMSSAGSRYAPSSPLKNIIHHLDGNSRFAFVGKPCDVAALRNLAKLDKRVNEKIPYMLSFMCAGVPARQGTLDIVKEVGLDPKNVIDFRYRGDGWPGFAKAIEKSGNSGRMSYEESWQKKLSPHIQWRCKFCPDGTGEHADIACADAWYLNEDGSPDFSEHEGRSFAISRNSKGLDLLKSAEKNGYLLNIGNACVGDLEKTQFHQGYRKKTGFIRGLALNILGLGSVKYNKKYLIISLLKVDLLSTVRAFGGALKRANSKKSKSL